MARIATEWSALTCYARLHKEEGSQSSGVRSQALAGRRGCRASLFLRYHDIIESFQVSSECSSLDLACVPLLLLLQTFLLLLLLLLIARAPRNLGDPRFGPCAEFTAGKPHFTRRKASTTGATPWCCLVLPLSPLYDSTQASRRRTNTLSGRETPGLDWSLWFETPKFCQ